MQDWLRTFHGGSQAFPALDIAIKAGIALALGLLVGFEREWSNKDIGVRTFAMTALLGLLGALLGPPLLLLSGIAVLILIVFANLRGLQVARKLEATTSVALAIIFLLGVLVGLGHLFTPVAPSWLPCSLLLSLNSAPLQEGSANRKCVAQYFSR
jgi:MgtC family